MKILLSGATGLIGSALLPKLVSQGHQVRRLSRGQPKVSTDVHWDPSVQGPDPAVLEGTQAVVHLAGEPIASGRWTSAKKRSILESRVGGTQRLIESLGHVRPAPKILICASAIGFYGDRGAEILTEQSACGTGFLPDVCRQWEAAAQPAVKQGIRVVHLRFGMVLSARGGALAAMRLPFLLGIGGRVGSGKQFMSWITLDDVIGVIEFALREETLGGPVNTVSPHAITNAEYTKTLGRVLHRPTVAALPEELARLALGEMADGLLLASLRVQPDVLQRRGYCFQFPDLEDALRHLLI